MNLSIKAPLRLSEAQKSVVMDGLLVTAVLILLSLLLNLLIRPIAGQFGNSGLLIYALVALAVATYCLDRSLTLPRDVTRVWHGVIGGLVGWFACSLSDYLGEKALTGQTALLWLIFTGMVVTVLWRRVLPLGGRFFGMVFLMSWAARFFLDAQEMLANWHPIFVRTYLFSGYLALFGVLVSAVWLFLRARQRLARMWTAIWLWFFLLIVVSVFMGQLI
ncbi:MAG: hypothetical protein LDL12_03285 [Anaerolinea sp.]|nr:hypothetical protein [Anaerolinea sp.]